MKRLLAGAIAVGLVSSAGYFGGGSAVADDDTVYAVGGAKVPGIPWYDWTYQAGMGYFPNPKREIVDYPAGQVQGRLLENLFPGSGLGGPTVGESVVAGSNNLDAAIHRDGPGVAVGLSEGSLVLGAEQARLAQDPTSPPPDQLSFNFFGDPARRHAFGESFLTYMFPRGTFVPVIDYTVPRHVESQYDTNVVVAAYDGLGDFPDKPWNPVVLANAIMGAIAGHTTAAWTSPANVPPQNIAATTNSRGATTTTYLVPWKYLPLTLPLHYLGLPDDVLNQLDTVLQPIVDVGYSRNDNPSSAPTGVDPVIGMDPITYLNPADRAKLDVFLGLARALLAGTG